MANKFAKGKRVKIVTTGRTGTLIEGGLYHRKKRCWLVFMNDKAKHILYMEKHELYFEEELELIEG